MSPFQRWRWLRPLLACGLLCGAALACPAEPRCGCDVPRCLEQLRGLSPCRLAELYTNAEVGRPFVGVGRGRLVCLTDERLPRVKVRLANALWRGKEAEEDGHFINRWAGGVRWIDSHYVYGPSWLDGKPTLIMEYPPGTPVFANTHDELREIAPGLYLGPLYDRFPCPKFRGYIAVQLECR